LKRILFRISIILIAAGLLGIFICNQIITGYAKSKCYSDIQEIPYNRVGLLLGTSPKIADGQVNPFYAYRVASAAALIRAGKIKYLVISGDNGRRGYNEPESMRSDLIRAGIDSTVLFPDYAGFRTFDSIKRLKEIFGQDSVTIISQPFHNERAIYIAGREGITAVGFNARDVGGGEGIRTVIREKLARVKVFLDEAFGKKPRFLGKRIPIPS
jgi:SanA protein